MQKYFFFYGQLRLRFYELPMVFCKLSSMQMYGEKAVKIDWDKCFVYLAAGMCAADLLLPGSDRKLQGLGQGRIALHLQLVPLCTQPSVGAALCVLREHTFVLVD